MGAVEGEVVLDAELDFSEGCAGEREGFSPEEAVVDEEEVGASLDSFADGHFVCVDGGGDACDVAVVLHLEAVVGAGVVGDFGGSQYFVRKSDNFL